MHVIFFLTQLIEEKFYKLTVLDDCVLKLSNQVKEQRDTLVQYADSGRIPLFLK